MKLKPFNCAPLILFGTVYLLTAYVGVALLLWGPDSARLLYRIYAGVAMPDLSADQFGTLMVLLHVPVLVLAVAYMATVAWAGPLLQRLGRPMRSPALSVATTGWLLSAVLSAWSLWRGGAFGHAQAWVSSYESWVAARWTLFAALSVPEFMNLYVFLPILSALVVLLCWPARRPLAVVVAVVGLVLTLLLFQKKQPIVYLLVVLLPFWIQRQTRAGASRWTWWHGTVSLSIALLVYIALVFVPMLALVDGPARADLKLAAPPSPSTSPSTSTSTELEQFRGKLLAQPAVTERSLFLVNSIIFRTAAPAIYYPKVFPGEHPFYGLDLPLDGFTTDDNLVVWNAMWPDLPGGSVSAPFQFSIYAQVGLTGAMVLALLTGVTLALLWLWLAVVQPPGPLSLLGATLTLVFAIYIAIDTLRNSFISSYGLAWGALLLLVLGGIARLGRRNHSLPVTPS